MAERTPRPSRRLFFILCMALLGGGVAAYATSHYRPASANADSVHPLPHHFPKYPGGVSLRFAMVHDVIHERFPWHGRAYYEERNRRVREALKADEAKLAE